MRLADFALAVAVASSVALLRAQVQAQVRLGPAAREPIEQLLMPIVQGELERKHAAGVVVSVVREDRILYEGTFGYANLGRKIPIDPEKTRFGVASLSKAFTAAAVMQLVETGKLQLDRDISDYLGNFPGANSFGRPLTLEHLLTHTSGLDECNLPARRSASPESLLPWPEYSRYVLPHRLYGPTEVVRYSNHNYTMTGYIIEAAARTPFAAYMQENLLAPLAMSHSSFAPVETMDGNMATGYVAGPDGLRPIPVVARRVEPASSLTSSASDMAHFMIALTSEGIYAGRRILQPSSIRLMQQRHFESAGVPASGLGLWRKDLNGIEGWENIGSEPGFSSVLLIIPSYRIGFFAATNTGSGIPEELEAKFIERFFPSETSGSAHGLSEADLRCYSGVYRTMFYPSATIDKMQLLLGRGVEIKISGSKKGELQLAAESFNGVLSRVEHDTFRDPFGGMLTFQCRDGKPARYIATAYSYFERLHFYDRRYFQSLVLACSVALLLWGGATSFKRRSLSTERKQRILAISVSFLYLIFLVSAAMILGGIIHFDFMEGGDMPTGGLRVLLCIPVIAAILAALLSVLLIADRVKRVSPWSHAHYLGTLLGASGLSWLFDYWNLLPWRY